LGKNHNLKQFSRLDFLLFSHGQIDLTNFLFFFVDFDLTMSILANNLLRLFATDLQGSYSRLTPESLYTKFLQNSGRVKISGSQIDIMLRKKRNLPAILSATQKFQQKPNRIFYGRRLIISVDSGS
jgi:hypothetical protein